MHKEGNELCINHVLINKLIYIWVRVLGQCLLLFQSA